MSERITRREFIKLAGMGVLASVMYSPLTPLISKAETIYENEEIKMYTLDNIVSAIMKSEVIGSLAFATYERKNSILNLWLYNGVGNIEGKVKNEEAMKHVGYLLTYMIPYSNDYEVREVCRFNVGLCLDLDHEVVKKEPTAIEFQPYRNSKIIAFLGEGRGSPYFGKKLGLLITIEGIPIGFVTEGKLYEVKMDKRWDVIKDLVVSNVYGFVQDFEQDEDTVVLRLKNGYQNIDMKLTGIETYTKDLIDMLYSSDKIFAAAYGVVNGNNEVIVPLEKPGYRAILINKEGNYIRMLSPDLAI